MANDPRTDEALVARIGEGDEAALRALYARYAALVFSLAVRVVDPSTAEDVVQEVFLTLWRKHETFDPSRGPFKPWLARIAKNRALGEARRKRTRGAESEEALAALPDDAVEADEARWIAHRRDVLREALDTLPAPQRRAVSLAFLEELTHEQVAATLGAPLGTVKTRIRLAMKRLAPLLAATLAIVALFVTWRREETRRTRVDRALRMVTSSDVVPLRLSAQAGVPSEAHGSYRARPGTTLAVLTTSNLPKLDATERYAAWAKLGDAWVPLGTLDLGSDGRSLSVAEDDALARAPDEVRVTRESAGATGASSPAGAVVLSTAPAR